MARADKGMGEKHGSQHVGDTPPEAFDQDDIASEIHGKNRLQGKDQQDFRNERQRQAGSTDKTEGVVESFRKMDPKARKPGG